MPGTSLERPPTEQRRWYVAIVAWLTDTQPPVVMVGPIFRNAMPLWIALACLTLAVHGLMGRGTGARNESRATPLCSSGSPLRSTGTIHYFCDCQTGADPNCVAGSDANSGLTPALAKQNWSTALTTFNALGAGDTVALCRGGAWFAPAAANECAANSMSNASCSVGTGALMDPANTSTCDLRDYVPSWSGTAAPLVQASSADAFVTMISNNAGTHTNGIRIFNIHFHGGDAGPRGGTYQAHFAIRVTANNCTGTATTNSDWLVCNNTFDYFRVAWQGPQNDTQSNTRVTGNTFSMNDLDAILGFGQGSNNSIDNNLFDNNGGFVHPITGNQAHTFYITPLNATNVATASNLSITQNQFLRSGAALTVPGACATGPLVGHGQFDGLHVDDNVMDNGVSSTGGCEGMGYSAAGSDNTYFRNMTLRRNLITMGSGVGMRIGQAPGVIIEDNIVTLNGTSDTWKQGIWSPTDVARAGQDDTQNNSVIRNNTIYASGTSFAGQYGIYASAEGTGHIISNNAVYANTGRCFATLQGTCSVGGTLCVVDNSIGDQNMPTCSGTCNPNAGAYTAVVTNACFGGASPFYYSSPGSNFDPGPDVTTDPKFIDITTPPLGFKLLPTSPLIGAGTSAYSAIVDYSQRSRPHLPSIGAYEP